ncbi:reverse transcriptase domain-containing protein [Tanacetum coccineum]
MTSIMLAWPFLQWGIDIVGPLLTTPGGARFLVVAIDYFTKWVKAKPLISTTGRHMEKFLWEHIVCRFGRPQIIISDNGKQFAKGTFLVFCKKLKTLQAFTSVYHPQANGQVEVTNIEIVKGMERRLGMAHQAWVDKLPQVLWAHRTTPKSSNGETPFSLVYESEAVIPIEISMETKRVQDFDSKENKKDAEKT